jgi:hypothetical protein
MRSANSMAIRNIIARHEPLHRIAARQRAQSAAALNGDRGPTMRMKAFHILSRGALNAHADLRIPAPTARRIHQQPASSRRAER